MSDNLVPVATLAADLHNGSVRYVQGVPCVEPGETYRWGELFDGMWLDAEEKTARGVLILPDAHYGDYNSYSSTYSRSNFEALPEDFPDTFLTIGLSSHDGMQLALPMSASIPAHLAEILVGLQDYAIYDESHWSELEMKIQDQDWENCTRHDLIQELAQLFNAEDSTLGMDWDTASELWFAADQWELFRNALEELNSYPEFETADSCYYRDMDDIAAHIARQLAGANVLAAA